MNMNRDVTIQFIFSLIIAFLVINSGCSKDGNDIKKDNPEKQTRGIVVMDNASVRVDPYLYSSRVMLLNKGDVLIVKDRSKKRQWIGKKHDYWYNIQLENGISGWMYGSTIDILKSKNSDAVKNYLDKFWMEQSDSVRDELAGKWWSLSSTGDFTNHGIEIGTDGKYVSYRKGGKRIEGTYSLNFHNNEIIFLDGTSFGKNLYFIRRGQSYVLSDDRENPAYRFKKISQEETEPAVQDEGENAEESTATQ